MGWLRLPWTATRQRRLQHVTNIFGERHMRSGTRALHSYGVDDAVTASVAVTWCRQKGMNFTGG